MRNDVPISGAERKGKRRTALKGAAFYPLLAASGMKKNGSIYLPYLLAGGLLTGLYYMLLAVGEMVAKSAMKGGAEMMFLLEMCAGLCIVVMFLILFYINSYVMKRRKRELGLYCILGMEKRHLCLLMLWEVAAAAAVSLAGGIAFGILFSQFMFLVLLKLVQVPAALTFVIPVSSMGRTAVVFAAGYLAIWLYDCLVIRKTNPVDLLKSRQEGEREPRTKWLTALLGALTLAAGYGLALRVRTASEGLLAFFPAALLVIIATYCLFQAGSIVFLKFLRSRKRFYYRPENFIAVSGMLYRMKQNAAGLATIAVLSTALLVVLSSAVTLYAGEESMLLGMYPREYKLTVKTESKTASGAAQLAAYTLRQEKKEAALYEAAQNAGYELKADYSLFTVWWMAQKTGKCLEAVPTETGKWDYDVDEMVSLTLLPLEDYNAMTGSAEQLSEGEVLLAASGMGNTETIAVSGQEFLVKKQMEKLQGFPAEMANADLFSNCILVLPTREEMLKLQEKSGAEGIYYWYYLFDLEAGTDAFPEAFAWQASLLQGEGENVWLENRSQEREGFYLLYGSILFIGLLFVCLFLLATVLIIYYKQVTEGYDDRERFQIMEKVGMRESEIRSVIKKQVLIVFFLPLVTAMVHICAAARVLRLFLAVLGLSNGRVFWCGIGICCLVFGAAYFLIYRLTSRVYYHIVQQEKR